MTPSCPVCNGAHDADAHRYPTLAAVEWSRQVLEQAACESRAVALGRPLSARALVWAGFDRRAAYWAAQVRVLLRTS